MFIDLLSTVKLSDFKCFRMGLTCQKLGIDYRLIDYRWTDHQADLLIYNSIKWSSNTFLPA